MRQDQTGKSQILLACLLAGPLALAASQAFAQVTYTVTAKDDIVSIATRYKYPGVTLNQMTLALGRANTKAFSYRTERQLIVGHKMVIPNEQAVMALDKSQADADMARLWEADASYRKAVAAEGKKDTSGALRLYLTAAQMGHPLADRRLGELYDRDPSGKVPHDLAESLRFYREARKFGFPIREAIKMDPSDKSSSSN